ncbi:MAG: HU family DNA-binding protein [Halorhodospira sp.]
MNKADLAEKVAADTGVSKRIAMQAVGSVFEGIEQSLATGEDVSVPGFGKFMVVARPERQGRNPQTGEFIDIPAGMNVRFKPGAPLKRAVDQ